jgi:DNA-binding GntR family transcriptional regulator
MRFDQGIHRFTWETAGNPYLTETLERYFTLSLRVWYVVLASVPGLGPAVHDQTRLLEALLARDAVRARRLMRDHVAAFHEEIATAFAKASRPGADMPPLRLAAGVAPRIS